MSDAITAQNPLRIAIVGGGIAGLTLAVPLVEQEKKGLPIRVHVYEAAPAFGEVGAGVAFGPNSQRVLRKLGLADALDLANHQSHQSEENRHKFFDLRRSDPGLSNEESLIIEWLGENAGVGWMHRADFLDSLINMLPADHASFHKRLESYVDIPGSPVQLRFEDGTTASADVVIGCDGIKSRARRCMFADDPANPPSIESKATRAKYSGWIAYRGVVPADDLKDQLGPTWGTQTFWTGYHKHILQFPIRGGAAVNMVMFIYDPNNSAAQDGPWRVKGSTEKLLEEYKDFNDSCKTTLKAIENLSIWGIFELPQLPWYAEGRVALTGDAAHGATPHQGQGAGQCTEDSYILFHLLTHPDVLSSRTKIPVALQAYSHVRQPRATRIQRTSAENGHLVNYQLPGIMDDISKIAENMKDRMNWIWQWDEEKDLAEAYTFLRDASVSSGVTAKL